jgi:hypothetical protein
MALVMGIVPIGFKEAELALQGIKDGYPKAITDAINRSLLAGRTAAAKAISARYAIKSSILKEEGIRMEKATYSNLKGNLEISGPMLNVGKFTPVVQMEKGKQHVSVTIIRGSKKLVRGAFMMKSGRVVERRQPARYPLASVITIGVPQMAAQMQVHEAIQLAMNKTMATRLEHNVTYQLEKLQDESAKVRLKAYQKMTAKEAGLK